MDSIPKVHDLRHSWFTNAVRSKVYPYVADAILGHGDRESLQALYLTISDEDLLAAIDMMKFDKVGRRILRGLGSTVEKGRAALCRVSRRNPLYCV